MARLFDDASSEYLHLGSTPVTAAPFSWAAWIYSDVANIDQTAVAITDTAGGRTRLEAA